MRKPLYSSRNVFAHLAYRCPKLMLCRLIRKPFLTDRAVEVDKPPLASPCRTPTIRRGRLPSSCWDNQRYVACTEEAPARIESRFMSRAFVNEDAGSPTPSRRFSLPPRDDPGFNAAAAEALLEAAREGDTPSAEQATGFYWGEPTLRDEVKRIMARAQKSGDDRLEQLARRFLR